MLVTSRRTVGQHRRVTGVNDVISHVYTTTTIVRTQCARMRKRLKRLQGTVVNPIPTSSLLCPSLFVRRLNRHIDSRSCLGLVFEPATDRGAGLCALRHAERLYLRDSGNYRSSTCRYAASAVEIDHHDRQRFCHHLPMRDGIESSRF